MRIQRRRRTHTARSDDKQRQMERLEAIGRLTGGIAHDFNNLLMIMSGYAELLRDRHGDSREISELIATAQRATALTRQLLAYGRRQVLKTERLSLNDVVVPVRAMLEAVMSANVRIVLTLDAALPCVNADRGQLEQVVLNLALNARDAMAAGGTLSIRTRVERVERRYRQMPAGTYVVIAVSDTGIGMSAKVQAQIFEPFYTTKGNRGTGLGLSSAYGIVKQSGGFIWCRSAPGKGTTFTIYLRPAVAQADASTSADVTLPLERDPAARVA